MNLFADLHIHTTYSDSSLTPQEVVQRAHKNNLHCVGITDHDTIEGIHPTIEASKDYGIEVIPGIELSSEINDKDIHILGYLFDYKSEEFIDKLSLMQNTRLGRMKIMIEKLKSFGINNIELSEVCALAETDSVGRPHLATIMFQKGWVNSIKAAFDKYIADDRPAYVPKYKQTPYEAIELIKSVGGIAVLAHPMTTQVDELISSFVDAGLDGLEVYYPNVSKTVIGFYEKLATKYNMIVTGGSDAHGEAKDNTRIGAVKVPYDVIEKLKLRANCQL